ncbi:hypothetical protein THAOC_12326 [Thalassiosira oceanica]|uniref:Uncharacterized protein n=1 Tax=Thalassiosira oceanica TaxID=159749 RepID=K0SKE9_THAOC|nr:hypothetical protein THAOC_12326 [Thalassiosira oceanica]|eukprot:EJK66723.1 hypothetical protein THAOC_12326 [Thalassiosira oceanica]
MTRSSPTPSDAATMEEMRERIAFLENELVEAKLQVALAKSNEERLILDALQMKTAISELTGDESGNECVRVLVPMSDPFGRRNAARRPRLSHNSSASGLNKLLGLAKCDSYGSLDASSAGPRRKRVLNPGSCSSALNLLSSLSNSASNVSIESYSLDLDRRSSRPRRSYDSTDNKNEECAASDDEQVSRRAWSTWPCPLLPGSGCSASASISRRLLVPLSNGSPKGAQVVANVAESLDSPGGRGNHLPADALPVHAVEQQPEERGHGVAHVADYETGREQRVPLEGLGQRACGRWSA